VINGFPFDSQFFVKEGGMPLIRIRDLHSEQTEVGFSGPIIEKALVRTGEIIIGMDGEFNVTRWRGPTALLNQRMCCLRSKPSANAGFIGYAVARPLTVIGHLSHSTTVKHLSSRQVKRIQLAVPPLPEQSAIVRFLDHADRRIQRYIRAKERLIELLEEQKQAIIHQAVTGQIDIRTGQAYPAYKDSSVEWLGRVPRHWVLVQLGRIAVSRCDGPFGSGLKSLHYTDEGVRVVRLQNIGQGEFSDSDAAFISPEHYSTLGDHSVEADDVLIAGLGDENHPAGRACVAPAEVGLAMVKADCFRFRLEQSRALPRFIALQLTATAHSASGLLSTGATRQRINLRTTAARRIAIPDIREQSRIVDHITHEIASHIDAQDTAERGIVLLSEYRTRLIADVVTGKLDVREAVAALPDVDSLNELDTLWESASTGLVDPEPTDSALQSPNP